MVNELNEFSIKRQNVVKLKNNSIVWITRYKQYILLIKLLYLSKLYF